MVKFLSRIKKNVRLIVQLGYTAVTNGYIAGFIDGKIYRGPTKALCVPGLNCYSCPGALGSCPLGSLQAVAGSREFSMAFYVLGFLMAFGALMGRFVCGWLCPFGLVQDLLYKIPFFKKLKKLPGHRFLKWIRYLLLVGFVIIIPMFFVDLSGLGDPAFCKYICPSGTLFGGVPLVLLGEGFKSAIGWLFAWKIAILVVLLLLSVLVYRPFCQYLCPLGAIYGFFNPISVYRYRIDAEKCTKCGLCRKNCKLDIPVFEKPDSPECIRCGECKKVCPHGAISSGMCGFSRKKREHNRIETVNKKD